MAHPGARIAEVAAVAAHAQVAATVEVVLAPEVVTQEEVEAALVVEAAAEAAVASEDKQKVVKRPPFYLLFNTLLFNARQAYSSDQAVRQVVPY
ncbi:MAG: hypothetical protein IKR37_05330 [Paludibacteraceae bacterium]|nr:hypothetical protein [Paludibacteraceae bacterium]